MATNLELREPESSSTVIPIFRYDHTPIPNYFFDVLLPIMTTPSEIKVVITLLRIMSVTGDDEIVTNFQAIGNIINIHRRTVAVAIRLAQSHGILEFVMTGSMGRDGTPSVKIKITKRVNYKRG